MSFEFKHWRADAVLFGLGLLLIAFGLGIGVHKYKLFPYHYVQAAAWAVDDWREYWQHYLGMRSKWLVPTDKAGGVSVHDPQRAWPGHTFVTGYENGAFSASLLDMAGQTRHRWTLPLDEIWREAGYADRPASAEDAPIHGAALLAGGEIVMTVAGQVLVRLDACSNLVWSRPGQAHHAVDVLPNGDILTLGTVVHTDPASTWPRLQPGEVGSMEDGTVLRFSPEGELLEEISLLETIYRSDWTALLFAGRGASFIMAETDPLHANDVEMLRPDMAAAFPMFKAGDLLVDLRNLQTMAVIDGSDKRIKWTMTGPFFGQHDPDFLPNGHILVFDNRITGNRPELGYSRLLEIDPATREVVWSHQGTDAAPFYSKVGGKVQLLPNDNVLVTEPQGGRVFELARHDGTGTIVWEYVNLVAPGSAGMLFDAIRVPEIREPWVGAACGS